MSKYVPVTHTVQVIPNGYTGASNISGSTSTYPYSNAYHTADNTTYARLTPTRNTTWTIYFTFASPSPAIPSNATITGISARFKAAPSNTTRITAATAQLSVGTTTRGTAVSFRDSTTASVKTLDAGAISNWSVSDFSNLRIKLTGTRNNTNTNTYIYMYGADVTITYTVDEIVYEVTVDSTDGHGTVAPMSGDALPGSDYTLSFTNEQSGVRPYQVLDNGVDVTSQLVAGGGQASSYAVATATGASYGFTQSGDYWVSANTGRNSSAAVAVITLTIRNNATVTIDAEASSEEDYDYGYLSEIGQTFSTSASAESNYKWRGSGTDYGTVNYGTLTPGTYQIYAKYYKDQYTASGDDIFQFKVNISETIPPAGNFNYTISNIQADHSIEVLFKQVTHYTVSGTIASSLSVTPSLPQSVAEGDNFSITITPTLPGTITVIDNNVAVETYVIDPDDISAVTYEIENVLADHTLNIQFTELTKYTINGTIVSGLSISPSLPQQVYKGKDIVFEITPTEGGTITVNDNGDITNYGIPRDSVHPVDYLITNVSAAHTLTITFTPVQQYQITGTVDSHITISPSLPHSAYTGDDVIFTLTPSAGGTITVDDNGNITTYAIPRTDVHSVQYVIYAISVAHTLNISYEPPEQFTISGTVGSGVTCSPSLPQSVYTGDSLNFTLTPSGAGIIRVVDNGAEAAVYEIPSSDISSVVYSLPTISESHVLAITYESLPQYTISAAEVASELSVSPSLPITKYLGESQTITITPNTSGQITILDNGNETAVHYITPESIHAVTYSLTNISANHELELKFSALPQFTATATLTGTGSLSPSSKTDYAGRNVTFTVTGVPNSNILIIRNNGRNVSGDATQSGTTYVYTFELVRNCTVEFTSKMPSNVTVNAYIDEGGTISPATTTIQEGSEYTLQITPNDYKTTATPPISVSDNYEEVVDQLVAKKDTSSSIYTATSETHSSIQSGTSYLTYCIGRTAENPYSSTNNCYASNNTTGYAIYSFDVSAIPADAIITNVSCKVNGHLENSSIQSNRFCRVQLYANTTAKGTVQNFPSTSNTTMELEDVGTWTRSEVSNIKLRMEVGYYGGLVCGISLTIEYELDEIRYYYTTTVYEAKEIYVKYKPDFYIKVARQWVGRTLTSMLPKINGERKRVKGLYVKINDEWMSVD